MEGYINPVVKECKRSIRIAAQTYDTSIVRDNTVFVDGDIVYDAIEKMANEIDRLEKLSENILSASAKL